MKAAMDSASANVKRLEAMEDFKNIVAPFDGIVTARKTDVGALINAGNAGQELFEVSIFLPLSLPMSHRSLPTADNQGFLLSGEVGLADYYLLPSTYAFGLAPEAKAMYADFPAVRGWRERMEALPTVQRFRAAQPPRAPIEHARKWAVSHRPKY
jgi:multidrug efflux pump subunit AcrA (membrane-fusion protein)